MPTPLWPETGTQLAIYLFCSAWCWRPTRPSLCRHIISHSSQLRAMNSHGPLAAWLGAGRAPANVRAASKLFCYSSIYFSFILVVVMKLTARSKPNTDQEPGPLKWCPICGRRLNGWPIMRYLAAIVVVHAPLASGRHRQRARYRLLLGPLAAGPPETIWPALVPPLCGQAPSEPIIKRPGRKCAHLSGKGHISGAGKRYRQFAWGKLQASPPKWCPFLALGPAAAVKTVRQCAALGAGPSSMLLNYNNNNNNDDRRQQTKLSI